MNIELILVKFLFLLVQSFVMPAIRIANLFKTRRMTPPLKNPLLLLSATKLAAKIRTSEISSEQVIRAYIARIQEVNSTINAVVEDRFEQALRDAMEIDKFLSFTLKSEQELEKDTPLLGVPITVKESLAVTGMSNGAGVVYQEKRVANADADIVRMCRRAGAIPLVVTNTPELCMYWESYNNVTGRTVNPYDTRRTAGGSSGGEAALLGCGASILGLGSDICGSLRLPTMFTGVYGHKPSADTVPIGGHVPGCTDKNWSKYFATGPMTRYAEDMQLMLSIVAMPEARHLMRLDEPIQIPQVKFFYMENDTNSETIQGMREFAAHLQRTYNIQAKKVNINLLKNCFTFVVPNLLSLEEIECPFYDSATKEFNIGEEFWKFVTCRSTHIFPVMLFGMLKKMSNLFLGRKLKVVVKLRQKLLNEFKELLGDNGVLIYPTFTNVAHFHSEMLYKVVDSSYMSVFNVLGLPVTNCPMGYTSDGLPFGVQIIGNLNRDKLTVTVAQEIERVFGGWKPPMNKNERSNLVV